MLHWLEHTYYKESNKIYLFNHVHTHIFLEPFLIRLIIIIISHLLINYQITGTNFKSIDLGGIPT